ncbi:MAG: hypothetical protein JRC86_04805 [Deltaproteobacteria bacterium]|nr:hypothetical protein [Deltaproteobacteria bacterium]
MEATETCRPTEEIEYDLEEAEGELAGLEDRQCELEDEIWEFKKELEAARLFNGTGTLTGEEFAKAHRTESDRYHEITGKPYPQPVTGEILITTSVTGPTILGNRWLDRLLDIPKEYETLAEELSA